MTVKDLFDSVPYQAMEPHIRRFLREDDDPMNLYAFREAYDFIMAETPVKGLDEEVCVEPNVDESLYRIGLRFLDGDWWCNALAKDLVFAPGYTCDRVELAATCLWEMTFHHFSEDHRDDQLEIHKEVHGFLEDHLENTYKRMNRHGYRFKRRMNRSKRKRQWRQKNAVERLQCLCYRHELLSRMHGAFPIDEILFLFKAHYVDSSFFRSTVSKGAERIHYIQSMIEQYFKIDWSEYTGAFVWLVEPEHDPVDRVQWEQFTRQLSAWFGVPVQFGIYTKPMTRAEIGVGITWYWQ